jgi:hypothetical protein
VHPRRAISLGAATPKICSSCDRRRDPPRPAELVSRRLRVECLTRLKRQTDELAEYQQILKNPEATVSDFGPACYLAACLSQSDEADQIFADAEQRFLETVI